MLFVVLFFVVALVVNTRLEAVWRKIAAANRFKIFWITAVTMLFGLWVLPIPLPDVYLPHHLTIQATGEKQEAANNSIVEIRQLKYLNGQDVPQSAVRFSPDWNVSDGVYYSSGAADSLLEVQGDFPFGVMVSLRYFEEGGVAHIAWDGLGQAVDLYSRDSTVIDSSFRGFPLAGEYLGLMILVAGLSVLYIAGWSVLVAAFWIFIFQRDESDHQKWVSGITAVALLFLFLLLKQSYLQSDAPRVFRDTFAYVQSAEYRLDSAQFWAGTRSFSLPLFFKMLGTNTHNFQSSEQMNRIFHAQMALSMVSWGCLALVVGLNFSRQATQLAAFGIVLFFSLSLEVSLWDALLLSESLSSSLFVLLLAGWIGLLSNVPLFQHPWMRKSLGVLVLLCTVLYSFVRDSNIYFVMVGSIIIVLVWITRERLRVYWQAGLLYLIFLFLLYAGQTLSMSYGNRWQVFIYDHLAMRILHDEDATRFFENEGLPISSELLHTRDMIGFQYQDLYMNSPAFESVRVWTNERGKSAYFKYLLSQFETTLIEPLKNSPKLLLGSNLEYRSPKYGVWPTSQKIIEINRMFFTRQGWVLLFFAAIAVWQVIYMLLNRGVHPVGAIVAVLVFSLYPMMFIVWHGEPMEIERHAAQIAIQTMLAAWLSLILTVEQLMDLYLRERLKSRS